MDERSPDGIHIPENLLGEIFAHANRESPNEACGWLAGELRLRRRRSGGVEESGMDGSRAARAEVAHARLDDAFVQKIYPVPNASETPEGRFAMEPESQIKAMRNIRESGLDIVGTYHSHPKSPAHPSERDLELALHPDILHLIVSLPDGEARWWRITDAGIEEA